MRAFQWYSSALIGWMDMMEIDPRPRCQARKKPPGFIFFSAARCVRWLHAKRADRDWLSWKWDWSRSGQGWVAGNRWYSECETCGYKLEGTSRLHLAAGLAWPGGLAPLTRRAPHGAPSPAPRPTHSRKIIRAFFSRPPSVSFSLTVSARSVSVAPTVSFGTRVDPQRARKCRAHACPLAFKLELDW